MAGYYFFIYVYKPIFPFGLKKIDGNKRAHLDLDF